MKPAFAFCLALLSCASVKDPGKVIHFWINVGEDSASIRTFEGTTSEPTPGILAKARQIDSLVETGDGYESVLNFHIGPCAPSKIKEYTEYFRRNDVTVSAIGCEDQAGRQEIHRTGIRLPMPISDSDFVLGFRQIKSGSSPDSSLGK